MKFTPSVLSIILGFFWGVLGALATQEAFGSYSWIAAPAGPLIGWLVYFLSRRFYVNALWPLIPVSILSTFFAVGSFGLALGFADLTRDISNRIAPAVVVQGMSACLWGLVFIPYYWLLFPLAFANHVSVRYLTLKERTRKKALSKKMPQKDASSRGQAVKFGI